VKDTHYKSLHELVRAALAEDVGQGDVTSLSCLEPNPMKARIVAKSAGVLSGSEAASLSFSMVDSANGIYFLLKDGANFNIGDTIATIDGFNLTLLPSERVALNFIGHLSGVATLTRQFVDRVAEYPCRILDTRKTTPGWRLLEKAAVRHGGGMNHRLGLYDMILIKENHIASAGSITEAIERAQEFLQSSQFRFQFDSRAEEISIEVEVTSENQLKEAITASVDRLLLDNQSVESLRQLVEIARELDPNVKLEASGNVTLENVAEIAATGVDYVSVGALTHSAPVADFSMLADSK